MASSSSSSVSISGPSSSTSSFAKEIKNRYVLVVGKTGAGKSSFCRYYTRDKRYQIGHGLHAGTEECISLDYQCDKLIVRLIDTPGLLDLTSETDELLKKINAGVAKSTVSLNLIMFFLNKNKVTKAEIEAIKSFFGKFGRNICAITALVFTNCESRLNQREALTAECQASTNLEFGLFGKGVHFVGFPSVEVADELYREVNERACLQSRNILHAVIEEAETALDIRETFIQPVIETLQRQIFEMGLQITQLTAAADRPRALLEIEQRRSQARLVKIVTAGSAGALGMMFFLIKKNKSS